MTAKRFRRAYATDGDLLHVTAESSQSLGDSGLDRDAVRTWVGKLAPNEKDELIANLLADAHHARKPSFVERLRKARL